MIHDSWADNTGGVRKLFKKWVSFPVSYPSQHFLGVENDILATCIHTYVAVKVWMFKDALINSTLGFKVS